MAPQAKKAKNRELDANQTALGKFFGQKPKESVQPAPPEKAAANGSTAPAAQATAHEAPPAAITEPAVAAAAPTAATAPADSAAKAEAKDTLSKEQKQRIEENKRRALERKNNKRSADGAPKEQPAQEASGEAVGAKRIMPASPPKKEQMGTGESPTPEPPKKIGGAKKTPEKPAKPSDKKIPTPQSAKAPTPGMPPPAAVAAAAAPAAAARAAAPGAVAASRPGLPVEQGDERFAGLGRAVWEQYNHYYNQRIQQLRGRAVENAKEIWSKEVASDDFICGVSNNPLLKGRQVVIAGVVFKDMPSRPNVIDQYKGHQSDSRHHQDWETKFCSDRDTLWLEDSVMRLQLEVSKEVLGRLVTGLVAAVKGLVTEKGNFAVSNLCYAKVSPAPALPSVRGDAKFLAFISGLHFGAAEKATLDLAAEFLSGSCQNPQLKTLGVAVQRLIVCGGLVAPEDDLRKQAEDTRTNDAPAEKSLLKLRASALAEADTFFAKLAMAIPVDVMPGEDDPSNSSLPQDPLHPYLFKEVRSCKDFKSVNNPYGGSVGGLKILGHSGQPVRDVLRCTNGTTALDALKFCFEAQHLAPTAPDTLATQPFKENDPFVMNDVPHLLFSGGHACAENAWMSLPSSSGAVMAGTQVICVPAFHRQPAVVLVNLNDPRDVRVQQFTDDRS